MPESRQDEIVHLRKWCLTVTHFIEELASMHAIRQFEEEIEKASNDKDVRALRTASRDLLEWVHGFSVSDRRKLDNILRAEFGQGLPEKINAIRQVIRELLRRGTIINDDEYRLLEGRADEIYTDPSKRAELRKINTLLAAYVKNPKALGKEDDQPSIT